MAAVERSIAMRPRRWEFQVWAQAPLTDVRQRIPTTLAISHPQAGGVQLCGFADDLECLAYTLVGLHCPLIIVHPDELRSHMRTLADRIRDIAERTVISEAE